MKARVHAFVPRSRSNGPGLRAVLWFQGCTLGCPGCFNPGTHSNASGEDADTETLAGSLIELAGCVEGVTFSGGEPLEQASPLLDLIDRLEGSGLGKILFTGFTPGEIDTLPLGPTIARRVDAIIAGRYAPSRHSGRGLLGSTNQRILLVTDRYSLADFDRVPRSELILKGDGQVIATGVEAWRFTG